MTYLRLNKKSKPHCSICKEKVRRFFGKTYTTRCGHKFHLKCMRRWLYYENRATCPLCRSKEQWLNPDPFLHISGY